MVVLFWFEEVWDGIIAFIYGAGEEVVKGLEYAAVGNDEDVISWMIF